MRCSKPFRVFLRDFQVVLFFPIIYLYCYIHRLLSAELFGWGQSKYNLIGAKFVIDIAALSSGKHISRMQDMSSITILAPIRSHYVYLVLMFKKRTGRAFWGAFYKWKAIISTASLHFDDEGPFWSIWNQQVSLHQSTHQQTTVKKCTYSEGWGEG